MSIFNPEQFMQTQTTEALDTKIAQVPDGVYKAQVGKIVYRTLEASAENPERTIMELTWDILDEKVKKITGIERPTVRQSIWLDLTEKGQLAVGTAKNVGLGKLRDALGQNKPGKAWSPAMLNGGVASVLVKGELNKKDGEIYASVNKVTKAT